MNVCVVGLGKLGCPMAAFFQSRGHSVVGVDSDSVVVDRVKNGQAPVNETGLQELMERFPLTVVTTDLDIAVDASQMIFVIVPTPSNEDGRFSTRLVHQALCDIAVIIQQDWSHPDNKTNGNIPLIVLCSTVMPGDCASLITSMELAGELKCGEDFLFCYNPEFVALGDVLRNMARPDFVLIGEASGEAGMRLSNFWLATLVREFPRADFPPIRRMSLVNAEIAKLALNTFVTLKISYANMLGELCELTPGADAHVVTQAIGYDRRIGHKALRPGLGYGGPCFPRDTDAFRCLSRAAGIISDASIAINENQVERVVNIVTYLITSQLQRVAVLGLSYKPGTMVNTESQGLEILETLKMGCVDVIGLDNIRELDNGADIIVVTLPDPAFKTIPCREDAIVIDCWGIVESTPGKLIKMGKWYPDE